MYVWLLGNHVISRPGCNLQVISCDGDERSSQTQLTISISALITGMGSQITCDLISWKVFSTDLSYSSYSHLTYDWLIHIQYYVIVFLFDSWLQYMVKNPHFLALQVYDTFVFNMYHFVYMDTLFSLQVMLCSRYFTFIIHAWLHLCLLHPPTCTYSRTLSLTPQLSLAINT